MKDIYPRPAREGDIPLIHEWLQKTPQNLFDPGILLYKRNVRFTCAHNGSPLLFMPIQTVFMLESLAVSPEATELEVAKSIGVLIQKVICDAEEMGINEIYFLCKDEAVNQYAERHGWEILLNDSERKVKLFRWKVAR